MNKSSEHEELRASIYVIGYMVLALAVAFFVKQALRIDDGAVIVTLLLVPLLLYAVVSGRLKEFTGPGGWSAKFDKIEHQIDMLSPLRFLVTTFLSELEWRHLERLTDPADDGRYTKAGDFEDELRRLRALGFIKPLTTTSIRRMPDSGRLKVYFEITERGQEYLALRKRWSVEVAGGS